MSQEKLETVRAAYEEFARGDFSSWDELPEDFEFVTSSEVPDAGTYRGEAAVRWMKAWVESFEGHTIEATTLIDAGDDMVVVEIVQRGRAHGSETVIEGNWWQAVKLRDGEVARVETFTGRAQALEAAGLTE